MTSIIDRRLTSRNKTLGSRQRFIRRIKSKTDVKKSVQDAVADMNIADIGKKNIKINTKDISEPTFEHDRGTGTRNIVAPGNEEYSEGDIISKDTGSGKGQGGQASDDGDGEDEFSFEFTKEEFMEIFMEDFALPDMVAKKIKELENIQIKRAGFTSQGSPSRLNLVRTARKAYSRHMALGRPSAYAMEQIEQEIAEEEKANPINFVRLNELKEQLAQMSERCGIVPYMDRMDQQYNNFEKVPNPVTQAVMFCCMDVSGSMGEKEKDIAKRFFILLYLLLNKTYKHIQVVFVRHHTAADEVDQHTFFHDRTTGGTVVSSGYKKINEIIDARFNPEEWNIYTSQVSDGDNWLTDEPDCIQEMNKIMSRCQYHAYLEVPRDGSDTDLWNTIVKIKEMHPQIGMAKAFEVIQIWEAFRELFGRME